MIIVYLDVIFGYTAGLHTGSWSQLSDFMLRCLINYLSISDDRMPCNVGLISVWLVTTKLLKPSCTVYKLNK